MNMDEEALSKRHLPVWGGLGERRHSAVLQRRSDLAGFRKRLEGCLHAHLSFHTTLFSWLYSMTAAATDGIANLKCMFYILDLL